MSTLTLRDRPPRGLTMARRQTVLLAMWVIPGAPGGEWVAAA